MKTLSTKPSQWKFDEDFRRIGDLFNFEGPELTIFERSNSSNCFVFDWVDFDPNHNRWLILEVEAEDLLKYVNKKITHLALFEKALCQDVFCLDINNENGFSNLPVYQLLEVPTDYLPNPVLFDKKYCPDYDQLLHYLQERIGIKKNENRLSKLSQIEFQNLLLENQVYDSNSLARIVGLWILYNGDHTLVLRNDLDYAQLSASFEGELSIPNSMTTNLKSYGFSNAS